MRIEMSDIRKNNNSNYHNLLYVEYLIVQENLILCIEIFYGNPH